MSETSRSGEWTVKLLKNTYVLDGKTLTEAPAKGQDSWYVEVDDAATGQPGAVMVSTVSPWMPDHQHGTTTVGVTATGTNAFTLYPLNFYMAGYWEVTINLGAMVNGTAADSAMFPVCVPD